MAKRRKIWRGRILILWSYPLLNQEGSVSLMMGRLQPAVVNNEEDDFFGLQRLFYFAEVYVDWRVRLRFIQTSFETIFYL